MTNSPSEGRQSLIHLTGTSDCSCAGPTATQVTDPVVDKWHHSTARRVSVSFTLFLILRKLVVFGPTVQKVHIMSPSPKHYARKRCREAGDKAPGTIVNYGTKWTEKTFKHRCVLVQLGHTLDVKA